MNPSAKKSLPYLAAGFGLLVMSTLTSMTGVGQTRGDQWLDTRTKAVHELQTMREALKKTMLSCQRYLVTGDKVQQEDFVQAMDALKEHSYALKALDPERYGTSERYRKVSNQLGLTLEQLSNSVQMRQEKGSDATSDLLLNRQWRDADEVGDGLVSLERDESNNIRAYLTGDVRARGNSLPLVLLIIGALSGGWGLYLLAGWKEDPADLVSSAIRNHGSTSSGSAGGADSAGAGIAGERSGSEFELQVLRSELASAKEQLDRLANVDFLTEVYNARGLEKILRAEENRAGRSGSHLISMIINCDDFHKINEGFGHTTGDVILKEVASRIKGTLRPTDHVARVGGDEFLVLLPETQLAYGLRVAERIRAAIADAAMRSAQDVVKITASIGVADLPQRISSISEVVTLARTALKRSKSGGKNRVSLTRETGHDVERSAGEELTPKGIVELLCDSTQFRTVYQPIVELGTERVAGYEALTRGPDGSFESPSDFFRVCVENNILTTVDLQCLKLSLDEVPKLGHNMRLHVNIFPSTLLETPVENLLALFPQDRDIVYCLEISEHQFVSEPAHLRDHINALKQAGILVAIDDVGFGRSSLETLILLEPDLVKVDRKYVTGLSNEPAKVRLLRRLANVAKSLGAEIVAEGIEERNDLPVLKDMGINYGQGFLWGDLLPVLPAQPEVLQS